MKVFLAWSGKASGAVARALREWLKGVLHNVEPWMSDTDIAAGRRWDPEIASRLEETKIGVICVTPDNLGSTWLSFEAGALSKTVDDQTFVIPYLLGIEPEDIPGGPLASFQAARANRDDTRKMIETLNQALPGPLDSKLLEAQFEKWWPDLESELASNWRRDGEDWKSREAHYARNGRGNPTYGAGLVPSAVR